MSLGKEDVATEELTEATNRKDVVAMGGSMLQKMQTWGMHETGEVGHARVPFVVETAASSKPRKKPRMDFK